MFNVPGVDKNMQLQLICNESILKIPNTSVVEASIGKYLTFNDNFHST